MTRDIVVCALLLVGSFFTLVGSIGLVRFPDIYTRLHAVTKSATLGLIGLLAAAAVELWSVEVGVKFALAVLFHFITNPVGAHMITRAAYHHLKVDFWHGNVSGEWGERAP